MTSTIAEDYLANGIDAATLREPNSSWLYLIYQRKIQVVAARTATRSSAAKGGEEEEEEVACWEMNSTAWHPRNAA